MIRFAVVWHEDAQNRLAQLWLDSQDRNAVTEATHIIDIQLATDAELKGTAVDGELRELIQPPLSVLFAVSEPDRLVKVVHVDAA